VINFYRLESFGSKYDQVLILPEQWTEGDSKEAKAIKNIQTALPNLGLRPLGLLTTQKGDITWAKSLTKFHAFNLTDYTRVLAFDSDSLVLNNSKQLLDTLNPSKKKSLPSVAWPQRTYYAGGLK
jgi:hypothetical protein